MKGEHMVDGLNGLRGMQSINGVKSDTTPLSQVVINSQIKFPKTKHDRQLLDILDKSKLDDRVPNKASLKKMGFEGSSTGIMDMNGGEYYSNKNGDSIRVAGWHGSMIMGPQGSTCVAYKSADGKYNHEICYDPEGNPMKGVLITENEDGSIEKFEYEYDLDGNKKVTSYQMTVRE